MSPKKMDIGKQRLQVMLDFGPGTQSEILGECLWVENEKRAAFEWSQQAITSGFDLAPIIMPLKPGVSFANYTPFEGIHGLFSDSIPDGFGLRLMNKSLAAAGYPLNDVTPIHRLAWVGERGVGALTYRPIIDSSDTRELMDISLAASYAAQAEIENFQAIPKSVMRAGGSALGARPKFWGAMSPDCKSIILSDSLKIPKGFIPCLLKFAPTRGDKNEPYFEATCLKLAAAHGVKSARGELLFHPNGAALAVHRFDRLPSGERKFVQSMAALLGADFRSPGIDYTHWAQLTQRLSGDLELEKLYRQTCFNIALSIRDDHCKNFAFCRDRAGKWELSPAFDLCPSTGLGYTQEHTMTLSGKGDKLSRDDLLKFAYHLGLAPSVAKDSIDHSRAAATEFEAEAIAVGATQSGTKAWSKRFKEIGKTLAPIQIGTG